MNLIADDFNFEQYLDEQESDTARVKPASLWCDAVIERLYGEMSAKHWTSTGFQKMDGKFDLRAGEVTLWAGINGHGKTTFLSNVMLNVMGTNKRVCIASLEMKPEESMQKMTLQACGTPRPSKPYIRAFHAWTDDRLWIYDRLGKTPAKRMLALATFVRKEMGMDHLVIDSLMKCGIGPEDYAGQKDFVDSLCTIARDTGLHIHLVVHMRKGEDERTAPGKFSVKGASEITDLVDNLVIIWKNVRKAPPNDDGTDPAPDEPDAFVRIGKQRHHPWEGSVAFWFSRGTQQFMEHQWAKPSGLDLEFPQEAS
jgi:twinkle protein